MMGTVEAMSAEALDPVLRASAPSLTCIFPAETQTGELACPVHRVLRGWGHLNLGRAGALNVLLSRDCATVDVSTGEAQEAPLTWLGVLRSLPGGDATHPLACSPHVPPSPGMVGSPHSGQPGPKLPE